MPAFVMNYQWQSIKNIKTIVFDEADFLLVDQYKDVKEILEFYTGHKIFFTRKEKLRQRIKEAKKKYVFHKSLERPQFVFVGATIPTGGRKTTLSLIEKYVPSATLVQSSMTHKAVKSVMFEYIDIKDAFDFKVAALVSLLEEELHDKNIAGQINDSEFGGEKNRDFRTNSIDVGSNRLYRDGARDDFRVIIYVNTVEDAKKLFKELTRDDKKQIRRSKYFTKDDNNSHRDYNNLEMDSLLTKQDDTIEIDDLSTKGDSGSGSMPSDISTISLVDFRRKWQNSVRVLHRDIADSERLNVLDDLAKNRCNVVVTTDLASRGLDIPNVDVIVQFDFALNVTSILHRAGRTARAGAKGKGKQICLLFCL